MKIRVLVVSNDLQDPSHFYRNAGPLAADPRFGLNFIKPERLTYVQLQHADIVAFSNVHREDELRAMELAKAAHVPVWVDYDDNWLEVPEEHPQYIQFASQGARQAVLLAIQEADLITVATGHLASVFQPARKDGTAPIVTIRNGLNQRWPKRAATHNRSDTFAWRGNNTQLRDMLEYGGAIAAGIPETATFHALGWFPWPLMNALQQKTENINYAKELPINAYFRELENSGAVALVVPYADTAFNRCKSNVAQLEAAAIGALAIVPDWPEWQLPGAIKYKDQDTLAAALANFMEVSFEDRKKQWEEAMLGALKQTNDAVELRAATLQALVAPVAAPSAPPTPPQLAVVPPELAEVIPIRGWGEGPQPVA